MSNRRTPWSNKQQQHVKPGLSRSTPNDSVSDSELEVNSVPAKHSSASVVSTTKFNSSQFEYDKDEGRGASYMGFSVERNKYKNDFRDAGGIENQSVQELENYAVYKAEETTSKLNGVLKIAEEIREDASKTLVTLHQQGEQITRTHQSAADIDHDLSRGEKLLGNLGGLFSKTWKPKKTREIRGPLLTRDDSFIKRSSHLEQRQKLGLSGPRPRSEPRHFAEPTSALEKVEVEKAKQDDTLDDLSNLLGDLKNMALDMGSEIERQHVALDAVQDDVEIVRARVKDANIRGRRLLGK
ncbi:SNAP25 homologous protein SNAP33-like [Zingiber officinale]|uniref:SNAP25 homologous protein SNAP33-like n=1 Tax=Zingiber officinale TaxID=94328 RepID=UPI001C4BE8EA|nr:SNAP25 homologous protein SNAP33-like [Zingiber officinale]XP_042438738.1 SNAP25 homologous protein SNAP33-like [Zingiber officinale]XP_042438739.1 SNAP25 homologous protein SNAP33-like [Zingiber officinale]XP_042438740.1 SNAP25 homologous protein SNAP33-like [Zingiber officinale]